jgi:hypothetical protein
LDNNTQNLRFRCKLRFPLIVMSVLATIASLAAWTFLLWRPHAVSGTTDVPFYSNDEFKSHPLAGWYLAIVASVFSLFTTFVVPCTGLPEHDHYYSLN